MTIAQDPKAELVSISFSGGDDEFIYKVDKYEEEIKIDCDKVLNGVDASVA